jgi:CheY-like chemotaxis protein
MNEQRAWTAPPAAERRRRILVVDDHPGVRESLLDLLEAMGFEVACAPGGRSALDYLRDHGGPDAADVILLDYAMGDMTGVDFLAAKASQPALAPIPVVFVTADGRAPAVAAAAGHDCLGKPLEMDDLVAAIERQTSGGRS